MHALEEFQANIDVDEEKELRRLMLKQMRE